MKNYELTVKLISPMDPSGQRKLRVDLRVGLTHPVGGLNLSGGGFNLPALT